MLRHESEALELGIPFVAGVDEAGRGPLAGPVTAAAVVLSPSIPTSEWLDRLSGVTDSKKLSASQREVFFVRLQEDPDVQIGVASVTPRVIHRINILRATHRAMAQAVNALPERPPFALVDGLPVKGLPCPHLALVKGDARSLSIAAASIIAKVTRDRYMERLDRKFPEYGFARNKGYGTKAHLEAIRTYGASPAHRLSFRPVGQLELDI